MTTHRTDKTAVVTGGVANCSLCRARSAMHRLLLCVPHRLPQRAREIKWPSDKRMVSRFYGIPLLLRAARERGRNLGAPRIMARTI
jgi:hypothetical protein